MALEKTKFFAVNILKGERAMTYGNDKTKGQIQYNVDGKEVKSHEERAEKEKEKEIEKEWDGLEECEEELTNEKQFEELHRTGNTKEDFGKGNERDNRVKGQEKELEKESPEMEPYVKMREDQLLAMSGGNVLHYQVEAMGNMSGQNYLDQSVQVVTDGNHDRREFAMTDDVVEDAFDYEEQSALNSNGQSVDSVTLDSDLDGIDDRWEARLAEKAEESDRMAFPDLDDELNSEMMPKSPWAPN